MTGWRPRVNRILAQTLGVELQSSYERGRRSPRATSPPTGPHWVPTRSDRLVPAPVFILCSVRSGSTLLRLLLNGHSRIHAPHELHLRRLHVKVTTKAAALSVKELDLDHLELEHLLWDRVMHRELRRSGKPILAEKTPNNTNAWARLARAWPQARFVFLIRDPRTTLASWHEAKAGPTDDGQGAFDASVAKVLYGVRAVADARANLPGLTVRYEDLTADPGAETRRICEFLDVDWEPGMLSYGQRQPMDLVRGLGDWRDKIRSGAVQPPRPVPTWDPPPQALELCRALGYLDRPGQAGELDSDGTAAGS